MSHFHVVISITKYSNIISIHPIIQCYTKVDSNLNRMILSKYKKDILQKYYSKLSAQQNVFTIVE